MAYSVQSGSRRRCQQSGRKASCYHYTRTLVWVQQLQTNHSQSLPGKVFVHVLLARLDPLLHKHRRPRLSGFTSYESYPGTTSLGRNPHRISTITARCICGPEGNIWFCGQNCNLESHARYWSSLGTWSLTCALQRLHLAGHTCSTCAVLNAPRKKQLSKWLVSHVRLTSCENVHGQVKKWHR